MKRHLVLCSLMFAFFYLSTSAIANTIVDSTQLPHAIEDKLYQIDLNKYVAIPGQEEIIFSAISGPEWISITPDGILSGVPQQEDVGTNSFVIALTDALGLSANFDVTLEVLHLNHPPVWDKNTFNLGFICAGSHYGLEVKLHAEDPDGDSLVYRLVDFPEFVLFPSWGRFEFIPLTEDIGTHHFIINVSDKKGGKAEARFRIDVISCAE